MWTGSDIASGDFDLFFNYDQIQWETGSASGGVDGLGGISAAVGFNAGNGNAPGTFFELPGSLIAGSFIDGGPNSLVTGTNNGVPGQLALIARNGVVTQDVTDPTITITTPPDDATYLLNESINADYACEDEADGSGLASCDGTVADGTPIDTATVGGKTFTVDAADNAGNTSSLTHDYGVAYLFTGFFTPVDNLPARNVAKAGQAIPLKWRVTDANGAPVTTLTNVSVSASNLVCSIGPTTDAVEEYASGSSGLQNLGDGYYQFNWKTPKSYGGSCKTVKVNVGDNVVHTAEFSFTR